MLHTLNILLFCQSYLNKAINRKSGEVLNTFYNFHAGSSQECNFYIKSIKRMLWKLYFNV